MNFELGSTIDVYSIIKPSIAILSLELEPGLAELGFFSDSYHQKLYETITSQILNISIPVGTLEKVTDLSSLHPLLKEECNDALKDQEIFKLSHKMPAFQPPKKENIESNLYHLAYMHSNLDVIKKMCCFMRDLITCSNIIMPGILSMKKYYVFIDNKLHTLYNHLDHYNAISKASVCYFEENYNQNIPLANAYNWLNKVEKKDGYRSTSALGRAIAFFNRLIFRNDSLLDAITWTLVALESLYNNPNETPKVSIIEQITHKSQKIIKTKISKKALRSMYRTRSNFLHGSTDIIIHPSTYHSIEDSASELSDPNQEHLNTAVTVLLETLQYMIKEDKHELKFKISFEII